MYPQESNANPLKRLINYDDFSQFYSALHQQAKIAKKIKTKKHNLF